MPQVYNYAQQMAILQMLNNNYFNNDGSHDIYNRCASYRVNNQETTQPKSNSRININTEILFSMSEK